MRYLPLLLALVSPVSLSSPVGAIAIIPCPAKGGVGQWLIEDEREAPVLRKYLTEGDLAAFVEEMAAIKPAFGDAALRYAMACFAKT